MTEGKIDRAVRARRRRRMALGVGALLISMAVLFLGHWIRVYGMVLRGTRLELLEGTITGHGVTQPVSIVYDKQGVPHVQAKSDPDLFYGLGYVMAQDRFFSMDVVRKLGRGAMCKLIGRPIRRGLADTLTLDRLMRSFDFAGRAEKGVKDLDEESLALFNAYVKGVNRYVSDAGKRMPEYRAVGTVPEPWILEDCLVCMDVYGLSMTLYSLFHEYFGDQLLRALGPERARIFSMEYPKGAPTILEDEPGDQTADEGERGSSQPLPLCGLPRQGGDDPAGHAAEAKPASEKAASVDLFACLGAFLSGMGSNNWVVDGAMSASGKPILSNDPHVPNALAPTFWYHAHLQGGSFDAVGMMFSGIPLMGAGTNGRLAWGITNARCDYIDLFREKLNPEDPDQYLHQGEWKAFETRIETVPVKGGKPVQIAQRRSMHGAIIDQGMTGVQTSPQGDEVLALCLKPAHWGSFVAGYLDIPRGQDAASIREAVEGMSTGPVAWNTVYASADGEIGYLYSAQAAIRPNNDGAMPRPGTGEADWQGWVPFDELPHVSNPAKHFIVTANNKVEGPGYPHYLCSGYCAPYRAKRILDRLRGRTGLTVSDMLKIQMDVRVESGAQFSPLFIADLEGCVDPAERQCLEALKEWQEEDFLATRTSRGTSVYKLMMKELPGLVFGDELGAAMVGKITAAELGGHALARILPEAENEWFDDSRTAETETRKDQVRLAARAASDTLSEKLGEDPAGWEWGKLHTLPIRTWLGILPWNKGARVGSYAHEGADETVNNAVSAYAGRFGFVCLGGPSSRMSVDMGRPREFNFCATTGNSETPGSELFDSCTKDWIEGRYRTISMDEGTFAQDAIGMLRLAP